MPSRAVPLMVPLAGATSWHRKTVPLRAVPPQLADPLELHGGTQRRSNHKQPAERDWSCSVNHNDGESPNSDGSQQDPDSKV